MQQKYRGKTTTVKPATKHIGNWRKVFPTNCMSVAPYHNHVTVYYTEISLTFCRDPLQVAKSSEEKTVLSRIKHTVLFPCPTHQYPYVLDSSSFKIWSSWRQIHFVPYILAACLSACLPVFRAGSTSADDSGKMSATNQPIITHAGSEDYFLPQEIIYYSVCMTELEPDCPGTARCINFFEKWAWKLG